MHVGPWTISLCLVLSFSHPNALSHWWQLLAELLVIGLHATHLLPLHHPLDTPPPRAMKPVRVPRSQARATSSLHPASSSPHASNATPTSPLHSICIKLQ